MKTVITYGTFDLLHYGHIEILHRAKELSEGGKLIVAVSTDKHNARKNKTAHMPYGQRVEYVKAIRYVDEVIPEDNWEQKITDIQTHDVDLFVIGNDWEGKFDELKEFCDVVYLPRTPIISSAALRDIIAQLKNINNDIS